MAGSTVMEGGTPLGSIKLAEIDQTRLVVATRDSIRINDEYAVAVARYVPVSAASNVIKHRALYLPAKPLEYGDEKDLFAELGMVVEAGRDRSNVHPKTSPATVPANL